MLDKHADHLPSHRGRCIRIKGPNIRNSRRRMIHTCHSGPLQIRSALLTTTAPAATLLVYGRSDLGGRPVFATITATRCNNSNGIGHPCDCNEFQQLPMRVLADGGYRTFWKVLFSLATAKLAIAASSSATAVICVSSLSVVGWYHTTTPGVLAACRIR